MTMVHQHLPGTGAKALSNLDPPRGTASVHLDALRGMAAISVFFSHWWDSFYANYDTLPPHSPLLIAPYYYSYFGHAWVIVFFVLSGYLVGGSVLRAKRDGKWSWSSYLLVRLTRLYVVLVPALLLGGLLDWAGMHQSGAETLYSGHSGMGALYYNAYSSLTPKAFLDSLLFIDIQGAPGFGSNGPLWSLNHEFWYYIAFPFLVVVFAKGQRFWVRAANALALLVWAWFVTGYKVLLFPAWLAGVLILFLPSLRTRPIWNRSWLRGFALASGVALLLVGFVLKVRGLLFNDNYLTIGHSHWHPPISDILLSPLVVVLIWVILNCATRPLPALYVWLAKRAAASSYTLYLVHLPALIFLKAFLHLPRAVPTWQTLPLNLTLFAIVLLYAQLVYWLFEKNTDLVRHWIKPYVTRKNKLASRAHVA